MKKFLAVLLALILLVSLSTLAIAMPSNHDALKNQLFARGLSDDNVASLAHRGWSLEEQLNMSDFQLRKILGSSFGRLAPSPYASLISVTNVPDDLYGAGTEQFISGHGFAKGDFYKDNNGAVLERKIKTFANYVFNGKSSAKFYYLFGEYDSNALYHKGIDMKSDDGTAIYTAHAGKSVLNEAYGAACIQKNGYTYIYAHMSDVEIGEKSQGELIGYQSNVSPDDIGSHLHFEVRYGTKSSLADNSKTDLGDSRLPYNYM